MKLSDAPTTEAEIEIAAPASTVWQIIADLQTPSLTSPEFQGAEWLDGATGPAVGASFVGRNAHKAIGSWETTSFVIAADEPRELAYAVADVDEPSAVWRYVITPTDHDTVVLWQSAQIGPGRSGLSFAIDRMPEKEHKIVTRRLEEHQASIQANLAKIKQVAEGTA